MARDFRLKSVRDAAVRNANNATRVDTEQLEAIEKRLAAIEGRHTAEPAEDITSAGVDGLADLEQRAAKRAGRKPAAKRTR